MKVTKSVTKTTVHAEYCVNHAHEIAIAHLSIPQGTRLSIASKLQGGVPIDKVLDQVRSDLPDTLGRGHIVNKQDIRNIERQFGVEGKSFNPKDSLKMLTNWLKS